MKLTQTFRSLKYRNFRLFFPGLITSQVGIWIQNVALSWVVYDMTQSPFMMGTIMFLNTIPLFIITPFAGVIVDKFNRHRLLMIIQICFALQAFLMAAITLGRYLRIWNIIILGVFLNIVAAIDAPLRQSTYVLLVDDKNDLGNAISLNSTCFNMARLLGPAVAGVLLSAVGAGWCFAINFLCILPCVFLVAMMKFKDEKSEKVKNETIFEGLKEGLDYSKNNITAFIFSNFQLYCINISYAYAGLYKRDIARKCSNTGLCNEQCRNRCGNRINVSGIKNLIARTEIYIMLWCNTFKLRIY